MGREARPYGLLDIRHFIVEPEVLHFTLARLSDRGREGLECFVAWGGQREADDDKVLRFTTAVVPRQTAYVTEEGLMVTMESDSLFEINKLLFDRGETLAGQVHTHPTHAYHSAADDSEPMVTILGGLSVVVPDFGRDGVDGLERWAWYRLSDRGQWDLLPPHIKVEVR